MKRTISSKITFISKFIFPLFLIPMLIFWGLYDIIGLIFIMSMLALYLFIGIRLKKVVIDDFFLILSNYRKSIRISLKDIKSIKSTVLIAQEPVWIAFREPNEFGDKIVFMPKADFDRSPFSPHPIIEELEALRGLASNME